MAVATKSATSTAKAKRTASPLLSIVAGLLLLFLFLLGTMLHIQTSEAFFLPVHSMSFAPDWPILAQLWFVSRGVYSTQMTVAVIWGWVIEGLFLAFMVGYEVAHESVRFHNPRLAEVFRGVALLLIGFDGWTDYQFLHAIIGMWGAIAFSVLMCFVVFFFGTVGFHYVENGIRGLRA